MATQKHIESMSDAGGAGCDGTTQTAACGSNGGCSASGGHRQWHIRRMAAAWGIPMPPAGMSEATHGEAAVCHDHQHDLHGHTQQHHQNTGSKLPLTLISGTSASSCAALLAHLASHGAVDSSSSSSSKRCVVIVQDVSALQLDPALISHDKEASSGDVMVLKNGSVICPMAPGPLQQVVKMASSGAVDCLVVQVAGATDPGQAAEAFAPHESGDEHCHDASCGHDHHHGRDQDQRHHGKQQRGCGDASCGHGHGEQEGHSSCGDAACGHEHHHHHHHTAADPHKWEEQEEEVEEAEEAEEEEGGDADDLAAAVASVLAPVAVLDTCVTVVHAGSLLDGLLSMDLVGGGDEGRRPRHLSELALEQIEFADVLVLDAATDAAGSSSADQLTQAKALLRALNPGAALIVCCNGRAPASQLLCTGKFDWEGTQKGAGWLKALEHGSSSSGSGSGSGSGDEQQQGKQQQGAGVAAVAAAGDEPSLDGSCFVYRARWPFHPGRLYDFVTRHFVLQQPDWGESDDESPEKSEGVGDAGAGDSGGRQQQERGLLSKEQEQGPSLPTATDIEGRRTARGSHFGCIVRSKGFAWVATRGDHIGEWSQAGDVLSLTTGGPWFCVLPRDFWPTEGDALAQILADFEPGVGDRRQEVAFLGAGVNSAALATALDACLCTAAEMAGGVAALEAADPFVRWPEVGDMVDDEGPQEEEDGQAEQEEGEGEEEEGAAGQEDDEGEESVRGAEQGVEEAKEAAAESKAIWHPGTVFEVSEGVTELEAFMESVADAWQQQSAESGASSGRGGLVVVSWLAPWAEASRAASQQLRHLAAQFPSVACAEVDVTSSSANRDLAMSKVMERPVSFRKVAQPVLKSGEKWPAASLHAAPLLHSMIGLFEGAGAGATLLAALRAQGAAPGAPAPAAAVAAVAAASKKASASAPSRTTAAAVSGGSGSSGGGAAVGAVRPAPPLAKVSAPGGMSVLKRGAADFKSFLSQAAGAPVALLWIDSEASEAATAAAAAAAAEAAAAGKAGAVEEEEDEDDGAPTLAFLEEEWVREFRGLASRGGASSSSPSAAAVMFVLADAAASQPNRVLFNALLPKQKGSAVAAGGGGGGGGQSAVPAVQLYHGNKAVWSLRAFSAGHPLATGASAAQKLAKQLERLSLAAISATGSGTDAGVGPAGQGRSSPAISGGAGAAGTAAAQAAAGGAAKDAAAAGAAAGATTGARVAAAGGTPAPAATAAAGVPSIWNPPTGKAAKAGAKKRIGPGKGIAVYWPRMPCLRCGCPWWLGEDWDAQCARCGWDCEEDGYDDDSNPLPKFRAAFDKFTAAIKAGGTAPWP